MTKKLEVCIVTGAYGSGKSTVTRVFEELGYIIVQNVPSSLLHELFETYSENGKVNKILLLVELENAHETILTARDDKNIKLSVLLLNADVDELLKRYKLTRHVHPLQAHGYTLEEAFKYDQVKIESLVDDASIYIDTSDYTVHELRKRIFDIFSSKIDDLSIVFTSFGLKHGLPLDVDIIFDTRIVPNPYYLSELKNKTGRDKEVVDYIFSYEITEKLIEHIVDYLDFYLDKIKKEGRTSYTIGVCCSGGRHRSVAIAEYLANYYKAKYNTSVKHRDVEKGV